MLNNPKDQALDQIPQGRPKWGDRAVVLVPKPEHLLEVSASIVPGSGIVAFKMANANDGVDLVTYFEGNLNGASNMKTLEDRAIQAYGRMTQSYPTIARLHMRSEHFEVIGHISPYGFDISRDSAALAAWVAHDPALLESPARHRKFGR